MARTRSSAGERCLHTAEVVGSIPTASTTFRGDVAEAIAAASLIELGYGVSRPLSNGLPYDLIADDGQKLHRIQVKHGVMRYGTLRGRMVSSKYHRSQRASIDYIGRVDWILVVWPETRRCFVVRPDEVADTIVLRVEPSLNNQQQGIRWAADYELAVALGPARAYCGVE